MAAIYKLSGTGNTFLLIDMRSKNARRSFLKQWRNKKRSLLARELCDPFQSVGADGLLFLENSAQADVKWDFYNADGTHAEMCGNAARCVGRYFFSCNAVRMSNVSIETQAGVITVQCQNDFFDVEMPEVIDYQKQIPIQLSNKKQTFDYVNTGVPHAVVNASPLKNLESLQENVDILVEIVNKIRALKPFKKSGTNVTFYTKKSSAAIDSLTFERGVPGYTQSCGTGAVAAAFCFAQGRPLHVRVKVPGGNLKINLKDARPHLMGPAKAIAKIEVL